MDYEKLKNWRNAHNTFSSRNGILIQELRAGYSKVTKTITEEDGNTMGGTHGGIYFTMGDVACGSVMATHGHAAVTVNASYNFLRGAAVGDTLIAEATETKYGRTICVYDVRITKEDGTLVGSGTYTFYQLEQLLEF